MRIVLVHGRYFNSWEALGLGYIGAYLKHKVESVELEYYQGSFDDDNTIVSAGERADIVALSSTSPSFPHTLRLARAIKEANPTVRTISGGYHSSAIPNLALLPGIDQVVVGEGEAALLDIIQGDRSQVVHGRTMAFEELPFPDRELIRNARNVDVAQSDTGLRITSFQSHRSCPFQCTFCADGYNKVLYGGRIGKAPMRYRDVENLMDEIELVVSRYKLDLIKFSDPTWNTDIEWVIKFCEAKIQRQNHTPFQPNIHASLISQEMVESMALAGCSQVAIGIESGSPKVLKQIGKGISRKSIENAVSLFRQAGISVRGYFILGMPDETESDLKQTEEFAEQLDLDEYGFTILCPYPGTKMYDEKLHRHVNWEDTDEYSNDFWSTKHVSNDQLKAWQKRLCEKFFDKLTWHNRILTSEE